jgi:multidrug efflux pump subunit AcrA (membrane-fusion protein)
MSGLRNFVFKRGPALVLVLATLGVLWAFGYSFYARARADAKRSRMFGWPQPVRTAQIQTKEVEKVIGATAITASPEVAFVALSSSQILFPDSGKADELRLNVVNVHEGDYVKKGQILFEVDPAAFKIFEEPKHAAVVAAKAQLDYVKGSAPLNKQVREINLKSAEMELKFRREDMTNWKRGTDIYKGLQIQKAESEVSLYTVTSTYLFAAYNHALAQSALEIAKKNSQMGDLKDAADVAQAESNYRATLQAEQQLRQEMGRLKIRSPLDGYVSYANKPEIIAGSMIANTSTTVCQIVKLDPIFVVMDFPQERIDELSLGLKARVVLDSWPQEPFEGTVVRVSPLVDPQTRTTPVTVSLPNPHGRIKAGISGFVRLYVKNAATEVPATAVFQSQNNAMVLRVENGKAVARTIRTTALAELGMLEVKEGLKAGDEVMIFSSFYHDMGGLVPKNAYVREGDVVNADWKEWTRRQ